MQLQDALKYNGYAIGAIKCTFARIYNEPIDGASIYAIQREWIDKIAETDYQYFTSDELAKIAEMYPSEEVYTNAQGYEDGELTRIHRGYIVSTNKNMQPVEKYQSCYLLSDAIVSIDKGMAQQVAKWTRQSGKYAWELAHHREIIESLSAQVENNTPVYVRTESIEWYPDLSKAADGSARLNPYEAAYIAAEEEESKLRMLMLAAGAASLL